MENIVDLLININLLKLIYRCEISFKGNFSYFDFFCCDRYFVCLDYEFKRKKKIELLVFFFW